MYWFLKRTNKGTYMTMSTTSTPEKSFLKWLKNCDLIIEWWLVSLPMIFLFLGASLFTILWRKALDTTKCVHDGCWKCSTTSSKSKKLPMNESWRFFTGFEMWISYSKTKINAIATLNFIGTEKVWAISINKSNNDGYRFSGRQRCSFGWVHKTWDNNYRWRVLPKD